VRQRRTSSESLAEERKRSSGVVVSILVVAFCSLFASHWHSKQKINTVEILGASTLSTQAIKLITDSCLHCKRATVCLADVRSKIEGIPFVKNAAVYFSGVRGVTVDVEERAPIAHIMQADGTLRLVDATGMVLPKTTITTSFDLPIIRANRQLKKWEIEHAAHVLSTASHELESSLYGSLSELVIDGDGSARMITDRTTWQLGNLATMKPVDVFGDMNVFWQRAGQNSMTSLAHVIDLRWNHHIIVRSPNSTIGA